MKIFLIRHKGSFEYDSYDSHVIVASTENQVRKLAKSISADEGDVVWDSANIIEQGEYTGEVPKPFILLSSFNAG